MRIKNTADLDREILVLENEEVFKRKNLVNHIVTPTALLHTTSELFKYWIMVGSKHSGQASNLKLLKWIPKLLMPLTLFRTVLNGSGHILRSIFNMVTGLITGIAKTHSK